MKHPVRSTLGLVLAGALAVGAALAQEHAMLHASNPADGAVLEAPPRQLELTFMHPVQLNLVTVSTLAGESIPVAGRVVAVADVFDILVHERPWKQEWTVEDAAAEIRRSAGRTSIPRSSRRSRTSAPPRGRR